MCDYSLHGVASRPAKVGDKLVSTSFSHVITRGFAAVGEPNAAVCLRPGTEVVFEREVECEGGRRFPFMIASNEKLGHKVARFRHVNKDNPHTHHDALEFPNGQIVLLTNLREGQHATVLQLPAAPHNTKESEEQKRVAFVG